MILYSYGMNSKKMIVSKIYWNAWNHQNQLNIYAVIKSLVGLECHWIEKIFILIFFSNHRNDKKNKNKDLHWKLYCRKDKLLGMVIQKCIWYILNVTFMIPGFLLCILLKTTVLATDPIWLVNLIIRHVFLYNFLIREIL
jgi:hypothetical protein